MSAPIQGRHRIDVDIKQLIENNYNVTMLDKKNQFIVKFRGPKGTPYEGGVWKISVFLFETYPLSPPLIMFMNQIYHPNIKFTSGRVCLDIVLRNWKPQFTLYYLFEHCLPQLLVYPNPTDPCNFSAANLFRYNREEFKKRTAEYTKKFANEEMLEAEEAANGEDGEQTATSQTEL